MTYEITLTSEDIDTLKDGTPVVKAVKGGIVRVIPDMDMEYGQIEDQKIYQS